MRFKLYQMRATQKSSKRSNAALRSLEYVLVGPATTETARYFVQPIVDVWALEGHGPVDMTITELKNDSWCRGRILEAI